MRCDGDATPGECDAARPELAEAGSVTYALTFGMQSGPRTAPVGRYLLFGEIAAGGMATVHLGKLTGPAGFARTVAVKRLHAQYARDPDFVAMFLDEARLAARIVHPNVVPTIDIVESGGEIYLVMEYVQGASLARLLRAASASRVPPDPWLLATVLAGMLHGLHAAHEARDEQGAPLEIVHRDVSPQNVLVGVDGVARVLDFGVAKAVGRLQTTREGQVKGKFGYMAPEQIAGRAVTRRADVYAAAVVAWEAFAGQRLFQADNEAAVLHAVLHEHVRPPSELAPELPRELDAVVLRGLSREPAERFATAREMALELERLGGIAPASEVGAWVDSLVHAELAERQARVAEIESASSPELPSLSLPASGAVGAGRGRDAAQPRSEVSSVAVAPIVPAARSTPASRFATGAGLFVAGALVALACLLLLMRERGAGAGPWGTARGPSGAASTEPGRDLAPSPDDRPRGAEPGSGADRAEGGVPTVAAGDLPLAVPAATLPPPEAPVPSTVPTVDVSALPSASAPHSHGTSPLVSPPPPPPGPGRRRAPAAAPASACDPPYWIDESGHTRYKPACL